MNVLLGDGALTETLNDQQLLRYSRQIMLPELDVAGQEKLLGSRVLMMGAGGLGCPAAMYLTAAGVGTLVIVDHDEVTESNLQRQIAHTTRDIGKPKVYSVTESLHALNPDTRVTAIARKLSEPELLEEAGNADVVLDCTDNFQSRHVINEVCIRTGTPLVSGAAVGFSGQVAVFGLSGGPCYHCLYPDTDGHQPTCSESGILSPVTGVIGSLQATETIKLLTHVGHLLAGRLMLFDALSMTWQILNLSRNTHCSVCGIKA